MNNELFNKKIETLIGVLLIMPIYMIVFVLLNLLNLNNGDNSIIFPILMYFPIIIGIALSYKFYENKADKKVGYSILVLCLIAVYFYCDTYFVEHEAWGSLGQYFLWLICTALSKIMSCVFYGKIVGYKKALIFLAIYVLTVFFSFILGFWA